MKGKITTQFGVIMIEDEIIARTAGLAAMECYGVVGMAAKDVKDGLVELLKKESLTKGIKLMVKENKVLLDLHIIVEYGTNISAIADNLINNIKYKVEKSMGLEVDKINIFVEGVRVDH